jgi:hypothetical protein
MWSAKKALIITGINAPARVDAALLRYGSQAGGSHHRFIAGVFLEGPKRNQSLQQSG